MDNTIQQTNNTPSHPQLHIREDDYKNLSCNFKLPINIFNGFKSLCNRKDRTMSETIKLLVTQYVKVHSNTSPKPNKST